jgi:hypothetical protein
MYMKEREAQLKVGRLGFFLAALSARIALRYDRFASNSTFDCELDFRSSIMMRILASEAE